MLTVSLVFQTQLRCYSVPYEEKVAKFKGKKGSDVKQSNVHENTSIVSGAGAYFLWSTIGSIQSHTH